MVKERGRELILVSFWECQDECGSLDEAKISNASHKVCVVQRPGVVEMARDSKFQIFVNVEIEIVSPEMAGFIRTATIWYLMISFLRILPLYHSPSIWLFIIMQSFGFEVSAVPHWIIHNRRPCRIGVRCDRTGWTSKPVVAWSTEHNAGTIEPHFCWCHGKWIKVQHCDHGMIF